MLIPSSAKHLHTCTDRDASRYALNAVKLERGEDNHVTAVASDNRILVAVDYHGIEQPDRSVEEILVPVDTLKRMPAKKTSGNIEVRPVGEIDRDRAYTVEARCDGISAVSKEVEGRFPKWRECFPDVSKGITVRVNAELMAKALLAMVKATPDDNFPTVDMIVTDEHTGIVLKRSGEEFEASGVVLPVSRD